MNVFYGLMLFAVAFFGLMVVVGVVQARRKKERAYYMSAAVSFVLFLFTVFIVLNQFILALILFVVFIVAVPIVSVVGLPKIREAMRRDLVTQLQETDLSAPLRIRDFLAWKAWLKLASRWGIRKTMCLYSLFIMGVGGAMFFTLSIFGLISIVWTIGCTIIVGIVSAIFFHRLIRQASTRRKLSQA